MSLATGPRALLIAAVAWALPALAIDTELAGSPLHLTLTEWATAAYHLDNGNIAPPESPAYDPTGNDYFDWLNRLQLDAAWREVTFMARLDSAVFANAPTEAPGSTRFQRRLLHRYRDRLDFEKAALTYSNRWIDVTVGDLYTTYGRGLVLALRKLDVLGIDTTARGASVTGKLGDLTLNALGGFGNVVNVDSAIGRWADDPNDLILGAHADYRFGKWVAPAINASWVRLAKNSTDAPQTNQDQTASISGSLELPNLFNHGSAYAEYARQHKLVNDRGYDSSALYASAVLTFGITTILAEYKDYRRYVPIATSIDPLKAPELALTDTYTALPTLERLEQAVLNNSDVTGPRVRVDVAVTETIIPFVSVAAFDDRGFNVRIFDPYGGCEFSWQEGRSRASVSGGIRPSYHDAPGFFGFGEPSSSVWHVKYLASQWLTGPFSLELNGLHMSHKDDVGGRWVPWMEGQAYLSLKRAGVFSAAVGYEYYTEAPETTRTQYLNFNAAYTLNPNLTFRAMVGGQRGGIKCVNGICRTYPAFDGARLEIVAKY